MICEGMPEPPRQFLLRHGIDDHVLHPVQRGRKRRLQIIADAIQREALAFPGEVVVVGDGGQAGFRNHLGHRQPERHMHRDRQDVLRD